MAIVSSFGSLEQALANNSQGPAPIERSAISAADHERRRQARIPIALHGRYMLECGRDYPCITRDVSRIGMSIEGRPVGALGERVIAYLEELGRVEGRVVRRSKSWFAIELAATPHRLEQLDQKISAIVQRRSQDGAELGTRAGTAQVSRSL